MSPSRLRHVDPLSPRSMFQRLYAWLGGTRLLGWLSRTFGWKLDPVLNRLSRGRLGLAFGLPTALLETRGARTGRVRRNVLIYFHDGERVTVMPSHLGLPRDPGWLYNVRANPEVTFGGEPYRAVVVDDAAECARLWALADRIFPAYAAYRERAARTGRTIPIVQLVPG